MPRRRHPQPKNRKTTLTQGGIPTPDYTRRKHFILSAVYFVLILALVYTLARYGLPLLWPFLLAYLFAWLLHPAARFLTRRFHMKYSLSAALCLGVFFTVVVGLAVLLGVRLVSMGASFVAKLPQLYTGTLEPALGDISGILEAYAAHMSPDAFHMLSDLIAGASDSLRSGITELSLKGVALLSGLAAKLPKLLIRSFLCVIATVFMTLDFSRITAFVARQFPARARHVLHKTRETFAAVLLQYGKSYGIIMAITFGEIFLGLLFLRQTNALTLAALIALFDVFPIVGAGLILVPWAVFAFLGGLTAKGIGLLSLWAVVMVVRQVLEPRVVGHQVGLSPLCTLMAMFIGSSLFGAIGLLGLPIACAILKSLDEAGVIHLLKKEEAVPVVKSPGETEKN